MVSLARVEQLAEHAWPKTRHAALSIPEKRKGEQIVPRQLVATNAIPLLGAGKTDYSAAQALVEKELGVTKTPSR
jgi:acyl-[acyl-carrier-protein]-phospholipid O-acyltransferase / long-chain-fatty-acid--[acyl-carrier-protein] ligase